MRIPLCVIRMCRRRRNLSPKHLAIGGVVILCVLLLILDALPDVDVESIEDSENPDYPDNDRSPSRNVNVNLTYTAVRGGGQRETERPPEVRGPADRNRKYLELIEDIRSRWLQVPAALYPGAARAPDQDGTDGGFETRDVSRHGEAKYVDALLNGRRRGFFVDSGAGDGRTLSSTLYLEQNRGWDGVLVEPDKEYFKFLRESSGRSAARLQACLSPSGAAHRMSYVGELDGVDVPGEHRLEQYIPWVTPLDDVLNMPHEGFNVSVQCFPLPAVLLALRRTRVDFWALDVGAAEVDVLRTCALETFTYDVIAINIWAGSVNGTLEKLGAIKEVFQGWPYRPRRILPQNWKLLQAAVLMVERIPGVYPVKPTSPEDNANVGLTPSPGGANTTTTNQTASNPAADNLRPWIHRPRLIGNATLNATATPLKVTFREGYWRALRALVKGFDTDGVGGEGGVGGGGGGGRDVGGEEGEGGKGGEGRGGEEGGGEVKRPGFFVETNAREGQLTSTTLYLETRLNWTGVLLEPDPELFDQLLVTRGRASYSVNGCLGLGGGVRGEGGQAGEGQGEEAQGNEGQGNEGQEEGGQEGKGQRDGGQEVEGHLEGVEGQRLFTPDYSLTPNGRLGSVTFPPGSNCTLPAPANNSSSNSPPSPSCSSSTTRCVTCVTLKGLLRALSRSRVDFLSLHVDDWAEDAVSRVDLRTLEVGVVAVDYPTAAVAAGSLRYSRVLQALDVRLTAQGYAMVGSYEDDKHLLTTSVFYQRKG